jgi:hypothetical protein
MWQCHSNWPGLLDFALMRVARAARPTLAIVTELFDVPRSLTVRGRQQRLIGGPGVRADLEKRYVVES